MKKLKKPCLVAAGLLLVFAALLAAAYLVFRSYYSKMNIQPVQDGAASLAQGALPPDEEDAPGAEDPPAGQTQAYEDYLRQNLAAQAEELPYDSEDVYNILLVGTDGRQTGGNDRSDSMIVVSLNRATKEIVMTSFMRDIYCAIPGVGNNRLNAAHAYGGVALLLQTLEHNFGIHIDDYVSIDFYGFMDAVDAIGGVELEVSEAEIKWMNFYIDELDRLLGQAEGTDRIDAAGAGLLQLNGKQALAYSRVRYAGNADFERTSRQRKVLTAVLAKVRQLSLFELNDLMNAVLPCVTTNLSQGEVLSLLLHAGEYLQYSVVTGRVPCDSSWSGLRINGMSVLGIDFAANKDYWLKLVYGA